MEKLNQDQQLQVLEYFASKDKRIIEQRFKEYIEGDRWKCPPSPTKAHHWIEISAEVSKGLSKKKFQCKWCEKYRMIIRDFEVTMPWGSGNSRT